MHSVIKLYWAVWALSLFAAAATVLWRPAVCEVWKLLFQLRSPVFLETKTVSYS